MRRILVLTVCFLIPALARAAGDGGSGIVVEARVRGYGMTGWAGEHLHVRVHEDGRLEYALMTGNVGDKDVIRKTRLSASRLQALKAFLAGAGVRSLKPKFIGPSHCIDCGEDMTIVIPRDAGRQTIELQAYYPVDEKDKRFYPQPLRELVCRLERLRVRAALRYVQLEWCTPNP